MDPISIVVTILSTTNTILEWYEANKAKEGALNDLRHTISSIHFAVLTPLLENKKLSRLDENISGCLRDLLTVILRAEEHLNVWSDRTASKLGKWDKFISTWKPSIILDELKDDERHLVNSITILISALAIQNYARVAVPTFSAGAASRAGENVELSKFWDKEIGHSVNYCSVDSFTSAMSRGLNVPMDKALERTIGLKFDEYGVGGITRSSVERIVGSRSLKSIVTALKANKPSNHPKVLPPSTSSPLLIWVDDNPKNNKKALDYAAAIGIEVVTFLSTAIAKAWIEQNMEMLRTADSTKRLRFLSDLVRVEKKAGKPSTNTSAGEQLLRFLRGSGFQAPVLIGTSRRTLWKTEFVKQYTNAGSCSSYAVVTDYIDAMKTGVDGEAWKTYSAVWHRENHPFLITVHTAPGEASKHIQFAESLGVENISLPSTLAARDWFRVHKALVQNLEKNSQIRIVSNNRRVEVPVDNPTSPPMPNDLAGEALLRALRDDGFRAPILIFTRDVLNTQFVKTYEYAGSTTTMDVTKTYITALSQRSSTDDWWRDSAVLPVSSTPPVLVWVNDRPEVITPHLDHLRNLKITVVMRRSTADAVAWIGSNPALIRRLTKENLIRFVSNNSRWEPAPNGVDGVVVKNELAGMDLLLVLRRAGHESPFLIFTRSIINTTSVKDFKNAGSTTRKEVVEAYIDALAKRRLAGSDIHDWRGYYV